MEELLKNYNQKEFRRLFECNSYIILKKIFDNCQR